MRISFEKHSFQDFQISTFRDLLRDNHYRWGKNMLSRLLNFFLQNVVKHWSFKTLKARFFLNIEMKKCIFKSFERTGIDLKCWKRLKLFVTIFLSFLQSLKCWILLSQFSSLHIPGLTVSLTKTHLDPCKLFLLWPGKSTYYLFFVFWKINILIFCFFGKSTY